MPVDDISLIVNDPDMATPGGFIIRRYTVTVSDEGTGVRTYVDIPGVGTVAPVAPGGSVPLGVIRTPEMERQGNNLTVYTKQEISTGDATINQPADDIIWHGQLYQVVSQDDWSDWGFNVVSAVLQEPGGRTIV
jgi:hypothetical protein